MGLLYSATTWSSALLSWALSSFLPLHEPREGCFPFCWLASEPCQLCRFCLLVLSCWLHGPCWKPAQATQATWRTFAELHCGTCLNPRRVHRQYYEYFPSHLQYIAMAQGSKYWLALATRLLQVGRAAVWMRNSPREREKKKETEMKQLVTVCKMGISKLQTELNNGVTKTESLPSKVNKELYSFLKKSKRWLVSNWLQEDWQRHWQNKLYDDLLGWVLRNLNFKRK